MANIKQQVDEMFAELDTAVAMTGKVKEIMDFFSTLSLTINLSANINPFELIMQLLQRLGVTYDELLDWITKFLTFILPTLEVGVKGVLLANLKGLISCSIDPRIPDKLRYSGVTTAGSSVAGNGVSLTFSDIDYFNKLSVSPFTKEGKYLYFGTDKVSNVYELARCQDMDAFLWLVINRGKSPQVQNELGEKFHVNEDIDDVNLLEVTTLTGDESGSTILPGMVFGYANPKVISMCYQTEKKIDASGRTIIAKNTLIPISPDAYSMNWCKNTNMYLSNTLGTTYKRDLNKDVAICNFNYEMNNATTSGENLLRFTILPKVAQHIPDLSRGTGQSILSYRRLRFNEKGEPDAKGRYSYPEGGSYFNDDDWEDAGEFLRQTFSDTTVVINKKTGQYTVSDAEANRKVLQECYPGLTVFEFNYDYIMSLKLFDPKATATAILNGLLDLQVGINASATYSNKQEEIEQIRQIVKNIIEQDDSEIDDCFYSFSNEKYDALLRAAQEKRLQQQRFGDVVYTQEDTQSILDILDEYDDATTLHEQSTILKRAITQASITASANSSDEDKNNVQINFLFNFVQDLIVTIVESIFTPKVMILLAVNTELMGNDAFKNLKDFSTILQTLQSLIVGIIRNIKDLVLQELLKFVLDRLKPIVAEMTSLLAQETIDQYTSLIRQIIKDCDMSYFFALLALFKNQYSDTTLDNVDYPDIDTGTTITDTPKTSSC